MDHNQAASLLESLCNRLEASADGKRFGLAGFISKNEFEAIRAAIVVLLPKTETREQRLAPNDTPQLITVELSLGSLSAEVPEDFIACVDFGTAFSKGAVRDLASESFLDLPLGRLANEAEYVYPVSSSLLFEENEVLFGALAVYQSGLSSRPRLDSIKRYLSEMVEVVEERPIPSELNRTAYPFTYRDGVLLYLAYLTDLLSRAFEERGLPRYVRRRYTLPGLESRNSSKAREVAQLMERMLAEAQILADTFQGRWDHGIAAAQAYAACRQVQALDQVPVQLVAEGLPEAIAASQSAVDRTRMRAIMLVVDVGAGTSDIGAFIVQPHANGTTVVAPLAESLKVLRRAGDRVDEALIDLLLTKSGATPRSQTHDIIQSDLRLRVRDLKRQLFENYGSPISVLLSNDQAVDVTAMELEQHGWVESFLRDLRTEMSTSLGALKPEDFDALNGRCRVVLTGGGSRLPSLVEVCSGILDVGERKISLSVVNSRPDWLDGMAPDFVQVFDQMAVAAGGCEDPDDMAEIAHVVRSYGGGVTPRRVMAPNYKS